MVKKSNYEFVIVFLLVLLIAFFISLFLVALFFFVSFPSYGSEPSILLNYTEGQFTLTPYTYLTSVQYQSLILEDDISDFIESDIREVYEQPILEYGYKFYEADKEYFDYCQDRRTEINFTNPYYSDFEFNYQDMTFNYNVSLYYDLYNFTNRLKTQDCYFSSYGYTEGYLKDPYNQFFLDSVSEDFISLRDKGYNDNEIIEIATLFVQSITYGTDYTEINRYPYETFYEKTGNCLDKSLILVNIFDNLNYTSYIILGNMSEEHHAFVGLVCDNGNEFYEGNEICFIESTIFSPIGSESDVDIEKYVKVSEGNVIYSEVSFGKDVSENIDSEILLIEFIDEKLQSLDDQLSAIKVKMCNTDCLYCTAEMEYSPQYCFDAYEYNDYLEEYNWFINEYNSLLDDWYELHHSIEKSYFDNFHYFY